MEENEKQIEDIYQQFAADKIEGQEAFNQVVDLGGDPDEAETIFFFTPDRAEEVIEVEESDE